MSIFPLAHNIVRKPIRSWAGAYAYQRRKKENLSYDL